VEPRQAGAKVNSIPVTHHDLQRIELEVRECMAPYDWRAVFPQQPPRRCPLIHHLGLLISLLPSIIIVVVAIWFGLRLEVCPCYFSPCITAGCKRRAV